MTYRQFKAWELWKESLIETPDVTQAYLMQIAMEVRRVLSNNPASITMDQFKMRRTKGKIRAKKFSLEDKKEEIKSRGKTLYRKVDAQGNIIEEK